MKYNLVGSEVKQILTADNFPEYVMHITDFGLEFSYADILSSFAQCNLPNITCAVEYNDIVYFGTSLGVYSLDIATVGTGIVNQQASVFCSTSSTYPLQSNTVTDMRVVTNYAGYSDYLVIETEAGLSVRAAANTTSYDLADASLIDILGYGTETCRGVYLLKGYIYTCTFPTLVPIGQSLRGVEITGQVDYPKMDCLISTSEYAYPLRFNNLASEGCLYACFNSSRLLTAGYLDVLADEYFSVTFDITPAISPAMCMCIKSGYLFISASNAFYVYHYNSVSRQFNQQIVIPAIPTVSIVATSDGKILMTDGTILSAWTYTGAAMLKLFEETCPYEIDNLSDEAYPEDGFGLPHRLYAQAGNLEYIYEVEIHNDGFTFNYLANTGNSWNYRDYAIWESNPDWYSFRMFFNARQVVIDNSFPFITSTYTQQVVYSIDTDILREGSDLVDKSTLTSSNSIRFRTSTEAKLDVLFSDYNCRLSTAQAGYVFLPVINYSDYYYTNIQSRNFYGMPRLIEYSPDNFLMFSTARTLYPEYYNLLVKRGDGSLQNRTIAALQFEDLILFVTSLGLYLTPMDFNYENYFAGVKSISLGGTEVDKLPLNVPHASIPLAEEYLFKKEIKQAKFIGNTLHTITVDNELEWFDVIDLALKLPSGGLVWGM